MKLIALRSALCDRLKLSLSVLTKQTQGVIRFSQNSNDLILSSWAEFAAVKSTLFNFFFFFFFCINLLVLIVVVYGESLTLFLTSERKKKIFLIHTSPLTYTLTLFSVMESLWRLQGWMIVLICFGAAAPCSESALICSSSFDSPIMAECTDGRASVSSRGASSHQLAPRRKTKL